MQFDYDPGVRTNYFTLALTPTVRFNLILILSLADIKWKQYLPLLPFTASKSQNFAVK